MTLQVATKAPGTPAKATNSTDLARLVQMVGLPLVVALALVAPFLVYPVFLMKALCFALFACAFNLMLGFGGLLSFGHAAFFGGAAYVTAHAAKVWGMDPLLAILLGGFASAVLGGIFGAIAIRRQGIYFAMITLALSQVVYFGALQAPFTGGEDGIQGVPRGTVFGLIGLSSSMTMYYFVLAIVAGRFLALPRIVHSPFGQTLKAIRDNEPRAVSLGYKAEQFKLIAFVLSAGLAGTAGSTKALVFQLASLTDVNWHMSGEVVQMTLIGGVGTLFGPVVGAFIVVGIQTFFAEMGSWVTIIQGIIFVACVLLFRRGVVGVFNDLIRRKG